MGDIVWERLAEKKRAELTKKITALSEKCIGIDYAKPPRTKLSTKLKFLICRMMQQSLHEKDPEYLDGRMEGTGPNRAGLGRSGRGGREDDSVMAQKVYLQSAAAFCLSVFARC